MNIYFNKKKTKKKLSVSLPIRGRSFFCATLLCLFVPVSTVRACLVCVPGQGNVDKNEIFDSLARADSQTQFYGSEKYHKRLLHNSIGNYGKI